MNELQFFGLLIFGATVIATDIINCGPENSLTFIKTDPELTLNENQEYEFTGGVTYNFTVGFHLDEEAETLRFKSKASRGGEALLEVLNFDMCEKHIKCPVYAGNHVVWETIPVPALGITISVNLTHTITDDTGKVVVCIKHKAVLVPADS